MRRYICDVVTHRLVGDLYSIGVAPGVQAYGGNSPTALCYTPKLITSADGALFVKLGGENRSAREEVIYNPPQLVKEVVRLVDVQAGNYRRR